MAKTKARLDPHHPWPAFCSDQLKAYPQAFKKHFGKAEIPPYPGRGRPPTRPQFQMDPGLKYGQIVKHRRRGQVVEVTYTCVYGKLEEATISTAGVERGNLTIRQTNGRMERKTLRCSKTFQDHRKAQVFNDAVYNFVRPHKSLRIKHPEGVRKWKPRTPAMAAGLTDHVWSLEELLTYRISPLDIHPNDRW
jgi:hypothetical protein